jgi:hypothetical protein
MTCALGDQARRHLVFVDRAFEIPSAESTRVAQPTRPTTSFCVQAVAWPCGGHLSKFASRALPLGGQPWTSPPPRLLPLHRLTLETLPELFAAQCDLVPQLGRELAGLFKLNVFPTPSSVNPADDGGSHRHGI